MPISLKDKLKAVDKPREKPVAAPPSSSCYACDASYPKTDVQGIRQVSGETLRLMLGMRMPDAVSPERILYLDTETTGLSGGVGTLAFLVGVGYFEEDQFIVRQWVMRDYPEERFVLEHLSALISQFDILVTFNGRTFDVPLLQARMLMNRMHPDTLERLPHADLLHPARRIWKLRLGSCRLGRLEEEIFGMVRDHDLPGSEVPDRFFRYMKTGDFNLLNDVLIHNRQDIVSLGKLFYRLVDVFEKPEQQTFLEDIFSAGRALERHGEISLARKCYHLSANGSLSAAATLCLGQSFRRFKETEEAIAAYARMVDRREGSLVPYIELAKLYEHTKRDYEKALEFTKKAILLASEPTLCPLPSMQEMQNALQYRYMRLLRKAQQRIHTKEA